MAIPFLRKLRDRQRKVALVSNSATAGACVRLLGLSWAFEEVVDGTMIQNPKPAPDGYCLAAELLNVSPGECVSVEDSPTGATAARAAGTFVVGIGSRLQPVHVDSLFPNLRAIPLEDWLRQPSGSRTRQVPR
jgi:beta-phosphoglucomutase